MIHSKTGRLFLQYDLHDAGWATATVSFGSGTVSMLVSSLPDTLRELAMAMCSLARYGGTSRVLFLDEPGEHCLTLTVDDGQCRFTIDWFPEYASWGRCPESQFTRVLEGRTPLIRWMRQVHSEMTRIHDEEGIQGYLEKWTKHEFPASEMIALRNCISEVNKALED